MERIIACVPSTEKHYDPSSYRVVFFSSAPIGIPFLQALAHDPRFDLVGVVTMPDAPVGRWMKTQENIIKTEAKNIMNNEELKNNNEKLSSQNELWHDTYSEFIQTPRSLRRDSKKYSQDALAFGEWLTALQPDLFVVIAYGHIMPQRVLDIPVFGPINVHGSLLPEYRGASPLQSVFLDGKETTGITVMKMDAGVDTGSMIQTLTTSLPLHRTVIDLIDWIKRAWPWFLTTTLRDRCKWLLQAAPQDSSHATMCRKFEKEDGEIDPFNDTLLSIRKKRQAFALWPKLYFILDEKRYVIDALILKESVVVADLAKWPLIQWTLLHEAIHTIVIKPEGKKWLSRSEFVNGYL